MTTFHESQPQSRRAARQSERGEQPDAAVDFGQFPAPQGAPVQLDPTQPAPAQHSSAAQAPPQSVPPQPAQAAQPPQGQAPQGQAPQGQQFQTQPPQGQPIQPPAPTSPAASGRRARPAQQQGLYDLPVAEPLEYMTQGQSPAAYPPVAPQGTGEYGVPSQSAVDANGYPVDQSAAPYRVRDFSPEAGSRAATGRRSAGGAPQHEDFQRGDFQQDDFQRGDSTQGAAQQAGVQQGASGFGGEQQFQAPQFLAPHYDLSQSQQQPPFVAPSDLDYRTQGAPPAQGQPAQGQPVQGQPAQGQPAQAGQGQSSYGQQAQGQQAQGQQAQAATAAPARARRAAESPASHYEQSTEEPVEHQTLSRRELRQRQAEAEALLSQPGEQQLGQAPQSQAEAQAMAQAQQEQALARSQQAQAQQAQAQQAQAQAAQADPALLSQPPVNSVPRMAPLAPPPSQPAVYTTPPQSYSTNGPQSGGAVPHPLEAPESPPAPTALSNAMAEFEALTKSNQLPPPVAHQRVAEPNAGSLSFVEPSLDAAAPAAQVATDPAAPRTGSYVPPTGHWSRQRDLDDETQPWENTITREVGGSNVATTTSALVLPEIPRATHFSSALDSTGEVLLTGSIDLPRSLSSIGGDSRTYDDPQVDYMFDTQDAEFTGTDSAPVRAIRAVSTHTSARGVIHSTKPHGNRLLVVVFIATAALAVSVVGVLVAALVFKVF